VTTWGFNGSSTSGVLTITSGSEVAHITLEGNYTTATFTLSSDGHGGTTVVDPTAPPAATPARLVQSMAGLGASHAALAQAADTWRTGPPSVFAPRSP